MASLQPVTMSSDQIIEFFSISRTDKVPSFRALCNALKALSIAAAISAVRTVKKGRINVCDLGCGKGGDVGKWMSHRPRKLICIDGSSVCVEEAKMRYTNLVANGRGSMEATFHTTDLCALSSRLPVTDEGVDVICSNFFIQYAAVDENVLLNVIQECWRVLSPGGIFMCLVPDGDRVWSLLQGKEESSRFGHFTLKKCADVLYAMHASPFGRAYNFSLGEDECCEFVLFPTVLEMCLSQTGFVGALCDDKYSMTAQDFFLLQSERTEVVEGITQNAKVTHLDWLSLGIFRLFLGRKNIPDSPENQL